MGTQYSDLFAALSRPFEAHEVKTRPAPGGRQLSYITARTAMNRLDEVIGPENWRDEYVPLEHSVLCKLTIRLPDGEWITKCDAGGYAGMADQGDDDKSGFSDAFKRACAKFGVARYLYRDGVPSFADGHAGGPESVAARPRQQSPPSVNGHDSSSGPFGQAPRSGRGLFAWVKEQEQRHEVGLLKYLNSWAKLQEWPSRMVDWDDDQVGLAHAEAVRKLQEHVPQEGQPASQSAGGAPARDDLPTMRHELSQLVQRIAHRVYQSEDPDMMRSVLRTLANQHPEKKEIYSLKAVGDLELVRWYVGACVQWLAELEGAEAI